MNNKKNDRFQLLLKFLALSHKGLTLEEIEKLTNLTQPQLKIIKKALGYILVEVEGCFRLYSYSLITAIKKELVGQDSCLLYKSIGDVLNSTPSSVRKLEEHIHVLSEAKEWFQLKQIVSTIENFLILFNPVHKYVLGKCWENLIGQNYDPVIEYNKSLELFEMHYQPSIENLVRIVLQLSRFFKELVDFEASTLPEFRHPLIKNRLLTLEKKVEKKEKSQKEKTLSSKAELKDVEGSDPGFFLDDSRIAPEDFSIDSNDLERQEHHQGRCKNHLEDIGLLREVKKMNLYDKEDIYEIDEDDKKEKKEKKEKNEKDGKSEKDNKEGITDNESKNEKTAKTKTEKLPKKGKKKCEILKGYEKSNVDIPAGMEQYLKVFEKLIKDEDEKKRLYPAWTEQEETPPETAVHTMADSDSLVHKKTNSALNFKSVSRAGSASKLVTRQQIITQDAIVLTDLKDIKDNESISERQTETKGSNRLLDYEQFESLKQNIAMEGDSNSSKRQFYFYKRWIWIMFPWACMSIEPGGSFSDLIHKCFSNDLHYIKVMDELEITHKAQLIAIEAKLKKKAVLEALRGDCLIDPELMKLDGELKLTERAHNIKENLAGYGFFEGLSHVGGRRNTAINLKFFAGDLTKKSTVNPEKRQSNSGIASPGRPIGDPVSPKTSTRIHPVISAGETGRGTGKSDNVFLTDLAIEPRDLKKGRVGSSRTITSHSQSRLPTAFDKLGFSKQ